MPKSHYVSEEDVVAVIREPFLESDVYRVHLSQVSSQIMSLGSRARTALSEQNTEEAKRLIGQAYRSLRPYENTRFAGSFSGLLKHIQRIEKLF